MSPLPLPFVPPLDPLSQDAPPHTRLAEAYSTHHRSTLTLSIRARLASLLDLIELRLASAGPGATAEAERGLKELEKVWTEVLAMQEDGEGENEELSRAREVKATLEIVLSAGEGECAAFLSHVWQARCCSERRRPR